MHALHGGDDAEASKAWDIIGVPVLDVLDAPASIGRRPIGPDRFIQVGSRGWRDGSTKRMQFPRFKVRRRSQRLRAAETQRSISIFRTAR